MWMRLRAALSRLLFVLQRQRFDDETRAEMASHIALLT